jgi:catechol 2,3-dioxygenase-like lactoylglutathione lyase family enzyme
MHPHIRFARPTDNLQAIVAMYRDGLGFQIVGQFAGHDGFDGVMLGREGAQYHLEFTQQAGHEAGRAPTPDNLLVFYEADEQLWRAACERMRSAGFTAVPSHNPYWDVRGETFEDLDGYRVVWQHGSWPPC